MAIDANKIIQAIMSGSRIREEKGIIPLFGVYLSLLSVQYYNKLCFDFERKMGGSKEAERLLVAAGQECGYATFHGIGNSWEWDEVVKPMVESKEDQILGFASVAVAFGWGDLSVEKLVPGESLVIRAEASYEASGYLESFGKADTGKCYMLRGVSAAFMDLVYGGDYPDGYSTFWPKKRTAAPKGIPYCEFVARKSEKPEVDRLPRN